MIEQDFREDLQRMLWGANFKEEIRGIRPSVDMYDTVLILNHIKNNLSLFQFY